MKDELYLVAVCVPEFTHLVACYGINEVLGFIISDLTLTVEQLNDLNVNVLLEYVDSDEDLELGSYLITIQTSSSYSKSQMLNYFENRN